MHRALSFAALWFTAGTLLASGGQDAGSPAREPKTDPRRPPSIEAFFIGHSLISDIPDMLAAFAKATPELELRFKEQFIPGAPLRWQWEERERDAAKRTLLEPTFQSYWFDALPSGKWNVVVLVESVPRSPDAIGETREYLGRFVTEATKSNPKTRIFVYEPWHCLKSGTPAGCPYDTSSPTRTKLWSERIAADAPMWDTLIADARAEHPGVAIELIPVARALAALARAIDANRVPGFDSVDSLFDDEIHPNPYGKYFVACVHYAAVCGRSPVGLPIDIEDRWRRVYWKKPSAQKRSWPRPDPKAIERMQEIAWESVRSDRAPGGK